MVLRGPGGHRAGFVVWERNAGQTSLRCNLEGFPPEAEPPVAVALAHADGSLCAYALAQDAPAELANAPERLQALLPPKELPVPPPSLFEPALEPAFEAEPAEAEPGSERLDALWRAGPWPPPPGLPGARWRGGHWGY